MPPKKRKPASQPKSDTARTGRKMRRSTICPDPENMNIKVIDPGGEITDETAIAVAHILLRMTNEGLKFTQLP